MSEADALMKINEMNIVANLRTADLKDNYDFISGTDMANATKRKVFYCEMVLVETSDGKKFFTFEYSHENTKLNDNKIWEDIDSPINHHGTYKLEN